MFWNVPWFRGSDLRCGHECTVVRSPMLKRMVECGTGPSLMGLSLRFLSAVSREVHDHAQ